MSCSVCNCACNSASDCEQNFADSVYTRKLCGEDCNTECGQTQKRLCCNCDGSCECFESNRRNPFWPDFTHPRTLSCQELYCCEA